MKQIEDYLRHRPPMRLVEELVEGGEEGVSTAVVIRPDSTFFSEQLQGVPAWVGLEYMAQTAAVWVGMDDVRHQRPVELGFLVSARQYQAKRPVFPLGRRFIVSIQRQFGEDGIVVFNGDIHADNGDEFASARFTAYRPDDVNAYLRGEIR
jgi:predicted hotdog family 3-hydroxylacyl-ACP dehydratase